MNPVEIVWKFGCADRRRRGDLSWHS
jgi:hypothetical protein